MITGKFNVYPPNAFYQIKRFSWSKSKISPDVLTRLDIGFARLMRSKSNSLLKKHLTKETFLQLRTRRAARSNLLDCVQSGFAQLNSKYGVFAAEPDCYQVYAELFNPIIKEYHYGFSDTDKQPSFDPGRPWELDDIDPLLHHIAFTRIRCARSIKGFPFHPIMNRNDYLAIEEVLNKSLSRLQNEFKGKYYPLKDMDKSTQQRLIAQNLLFKDGDPIMEAARATRFWPEGRGVYFNPNKTFIVWCNEADHVRVISMQRGANFGQVFSRLMRGLKAIGRSSSFEWEWDKRLGYLTFCPMNLGSTIRASVQARLPNLASRPNKLLELATQHRLDVRSTGPKTYEISNRQSLGITEFEAVSQLHTGMVKIINLEKLQLPSKQLPKRQVAPKYISDTEKIAARAALRVEQQKEATRLGKSSQTLSADRKDRIEALIAKRNKEKAEKHNTVDWLIQPAQASKEPATKKTRQDNKTTSNSQGKESSVNAAKPISLFDMIRSYLQEKINQTAPKAGIQINSTGEQAISGSALDKSQKVSSRKIRMSKGRAISGRTKKLLKPNSKSKLRTVRSWRIRIWTLRDKIESTVAPSNKHQGVTQNMLSAPKDTTPTEPDVAGRVKATPQRRALMSRHRARAGPFRRQINRLGKGNYKAKSLRSARMSSHRVNPRPRKNFAVAQSPLFLPKTDTRPITRVIDKLKPEKKSYKRFKGRKWSGLPPTTNTQKINPIKGGDKRTFSSAPKKPDMPDSLQSKEDTKLASDDTKKLLQESTSTQEVRALFELSPATSKAHGVRAWKARISESQSDGAEPTSKQVDAAVDENPNEVSQKTLSALGFWSQAEQSRSAGSKCHGVHAWKTRMSQKISKNVGPMSNQQVNLALDSNLKETLQEASSTPEETEASADNKTPKIETSKSQNAKSEATNEQVDWTELLQKAASALDNRLTSANDKTQGVHTLQIETSKSVKPKSESTCEQVDWPVLLKKAAAPDPIAPDGTTTPADARTLGMHTPETEASDSLYANSELTSDQIDWPVDDNLMELLRNAASAPDLCPQAATSAEDMAQEVLARKMEKNRSKKAKLGPKSKLIKPLSTDKLPKISPRRDFLSRLEVTLWPKTKLTDLVADDDRLKLLQQTSSKPEARSTDAPTPSADDKVQCTSKTEMSKNQNTKSEPTSGQVNWPVDDKVIEVLQKTASLPQLSAQDGTVASADDKTQGVHAPKIKTTDSQKANSEPTSGQIYWPVDDNLIEVVQKATPAPGPRAQDGAATSANDKTQAVHTLKIEASNSQKANSELRSEQIDWPVDDNFIELLRKAASAPDLCPRAAASADNKAQGVRVRKTEKNKTKKEKVEPKTKQAKPPATDKFPKMSLRRNHLSRLEVTLWPKTKLTDLVADDGHLNALQKATTTPEDSAQDTLKPSLGDKTRGVHTPKIKTSKSQKATSGSTSEQVDWPLDDNLIKLLQRAAPEPNPSTQDRTATSANNKAQGVRVRTKKENKSKKAKAKPASKQAKPTATKKVQKKAPRGDLISRFQVTVWPKSKQTDVPVHHDPKGQNVGRMDVLEVLQKKPSATGVSAADAPNPSVDDKIKSKSSLKTKQIDPAEPDKCQALSPWQDHYLSKVLSHAAQAQAPQPAAVNKTPPIRPWPAIKIKNRAETKPTSKKVDTYAVDKDQVVSPWRAVFLSKLQAKVAHTSKQISPPAADKGQARIPWRTLLSKLQAQAVQTKKQIANPTAGGRGHTAPPWLAVRMKRRAQAAQTSKQAVHPAVGKIKDGSSSQQVQPSTANNDQKLTPWRAVFLSKLQAHAPQTNKPATDPTAGSKIKAGSTSKQGNQRIPPWQAIFESKRKQHAVLTSKQLKGGLINPDAAGESYCHSLKSGSQSTKKHATHPNPPKLGTNANKRNIKVQLVPSARPHTKSKNSAVQPTNTKTLKPYNGASTRSFSLGRKKLPQALILSKLQVQAQTSKKNNLPVDNSSQEVLQKTTSTSEVSGQNKTKTSADSETHERSAKANPEATSEQIPELARNPKCLAKAGEAGKQVPDPAASGKTQTWPPWLAFKTIRRDKYRSTGKQVNLAAAAKHQKVTPWRSRIPKYLTKAAEANKQAAYPVTRGKAQPLPPWLEIKKRHRAKTGSKGRAAIPWRALLSKLQAQPAQASKQTTHPSTGFKGHTLSPRLAMRTKRRAQVAQANKQAADPTAGNKIKAGSTSQQVDPATANNDQKPSPWRAVFLSKLQAHVSQTRKIKTESISKQATTEEIRTRIPWRALLSKLQPQIAQTSKPSVSGKIQHRPKVSSTDKLAKGRTVSPLRARISKNPVKTASTTRWTAIKDYQSLLQKNLSAPNVRNAAASTNKQVKTRPMVQYKWNQSETGSMSKSAAAGEPQRMPKPKDCVSPRLSPKSNSQSNQKLGFSPTTTWPSSPKLKKKGHKQLKQIKIKSEPPRKPNEESKKGCSVPWTKTHDQNLNPTKGRGTRTFATGPKKPKNPCTSQSSKTCGKQKKKLGWEGCIPDPPKNSEETSKTQTQDCTCGKQEKKLGWEGCISDAQIKAEQLAKTPMPSCCLQPNDPRCKKQAQTSSTCGNQKKSKLGWKDCIPDPPKKGKECCQATSAAKCKCKKPCSCPKTCPCKTKSKDDDGCKRTFASCAQTSIYKTLGTQADCPPGPPAKRTARGIFTSCTRALVTHATALNSKRSSPEPPAEGRVKKTSTFCGETPINKIKAKDGDPPAEGRRTFTSHSKKSVCDTHYEICGKCGKPKDPNKSLFAAKPPAGGGDNKTTNLELKDNASGIQLFPKDSAKPSTCIKTVRKKKSDGCIPAPRKVSRQPIPPDVEAALRTGYIARPDLRRRMRKAMKKKEEKRRVTARTICIGLDHKVKEAALHKKKMEMRKEAKRQKIIEKKKAEAIKKLNLPWLEEDNKKAGTKEAAKKTTSQKKSCDMVMDIKTVPQKVVATKKPPEKTENKKN